MKAFRILLALVLLSPLYALHAQIEERALMSVNIPFAFTVENTHLPAGHYVIYSELNHEWKLSSFQRGGSAFFHITQDEIRHLPPRARLVFHRYETEYVLREIEPRDIGIKAMLPLGKKEKELARRVAQPDLAMVYAEDGTKTIAQSGGGSE
jgi:hypothetical protein